MIAIGRASRLEKKDYSGLVEKLVTIKLYSRRGPIKVVFGGRPSKHESRRS